MAIPKVIHQTLSDKNDIKPILKANIDKLISLNPSWEHHLYDDQDARHYIDVHYGVKYLSLYDSLNPSYGAVRADLFRYLLMYKVGGVYLDIKSTSTKRLDQVLVDNDSFVISRWPNNENGPFEGWGKHPKFGVSTELQQWHIIAAPRHPFLRSVISLVESNIKNYQPFRDGVGQMGVLKLTGPIVYTRAIEPLLYMYPHREVDIRELGFQYSMLDGNRTFSHIYGQRHYSELAETLVLLNSRDRFIFTAQKCAATIARTVLPPKFRYAIKQLLRIA